MRTSARNALSGTVTAIADGAVNAEVTLALSGRVALTAVITRDSVRELGLFPGREATALIKSPFVILAPADEARRTSARNRIEGVVARREDGAVNSEVTLDIGAGTRARHLYSIAAGLNLPASVLAQLGASVADQNAAMLGQFLAKHGISAVPLYLAEVNGVVFSGMPSYKLWIRPAAEGVIPPYRTDAGCFLVAEQFGCKAMIYVKDEDGLYTANPKMSKDVTFIPRISVDEMNAKGLQDSILEELSSGRGDFAKLPVFWSKG